MEFDVDNLITKDKKTIKDEPAKAIGRPQLKEKKSKKLMAYFTENEYKVIVDLAEESGHSLSNFLRLAMVEKLAHKPRHKT